MAKPSSTSITTTNNDSPSTKSEWNYHPHIPIDNNPLFSWPIRLKDTLIYYRDSWLVASEGTIFVLLAVLSWQFFSPEIGAAQKLDSSWVGGSCRRFYSEGNFNFSLSEARSKVREHIPEEVKSIISFVNVHRRPYPHHGISNSCYRKLNI